MEKPLISQSRRRGAGNIEVSKSLYPLGRGLKAFGIQEKGVACFS